MLCLKSPPAAVSDGMPPPTGDPCRPHRHARIWTIGRERVRVEVRFTPAVRPLHPGEAVPAEAWWSESRYDAYAYVLP